MQAALAADRSMAAAAHKALASAADVARAWSENLGALQHSHQTNRAFGSTLHSLGTRMLRARALIDFADFRARVGGGGGAGCKAAASCPGIIRGHAVGGCLWCCSGGG
jgi:hypothetical protein